MPTCTKAYEEVRRFETTLYGAFLEGRAKKDISMLTILFLSCITLKRRVGVMC